MSDSKDALLTQVSQWICTRRKGLASIQLELDTDLIESRIIDSLMVMELLLFLEHLLGRELQPAPHLVSSLRTLRSIRDNIL